MKIQYFNGGLGNQLFQYIFYRYFQLHSPEMIWLDDMMFHKVREHNGYELERIFGLKPNLISSYFDADVWEYMVANAPTGRGDLCQIMKDMGAEIVMVAETPNFTFDGETHLVPTYGYYPELVELPGDIYFFGYWINKNWLEKIRDEIMKELVFPALTDASNQELAQTIASEECVSVHIRRGDFCTLGFALDEKFYHFAMTKMVAALPGATYLVFSDDIPWCQEHRRELGLEMAKERLIFVTGNEGEKSYIDMDLMSRCHGMILANSAFSYFAALYNSRADKLVINPMGKVREV
jgi:hypothetical protein